tara:strand:+ start:2076 stop:2870 length:795 start_codon:yes stop_codon:yes gene_type:complete
MADPTLADFQMYYTGGGSNSTVTASIGGAISSARVLNQSATAPSLVTGVTIDDAMGNVDGIGTLTFTATGTTLTWTPYTGVATTTPVNVSAGGKFFIQAGTVGGGGLAVTVVGASLPTSNASDSITVATLANKLFADVTKAESLSGVTKYHCFALKNAHASMSMISILSWIVANTPGADTISIGLDPLTAGTGSVGPTAIANENTAPSGVTFVAPTSSVDANVLALGTLTYGLCRFIWLKQIVPAGVTVATPVNTFNLGVSITA